MSGNYHGIHWNFQKRVYDGVIVALLLLAVASFMGVSTTVHPGMTIETLLMRCSAFLCLFLLQLILCIGPLARINSRFLPLLYNRRHLGVCLFLLASFHGILATIQHHALGNTFPLVSLFTSYARDYGAALSNFENVRNIPFEPFGALALVILYVMAATSHDFWLRLLGASLWKSLHTLVYFAYALIIFHVSFGFMQSEIHLVYPVLVLSGALLVFSLHLAAFLKGQTAQRRAPSARDADGFVSVCDVDALEENKGKTVRIGNERVALFRQRGRIFALSNVCRHQGGPIGEGRILDGCVTCPWHGWQYKPEDGMSPPPFHEHVPVYPVEVRNGAVFVKPVACEKGTTLEGAIASDAVGRVDTRGLESGANAFYVGYSKSLPASTLNFLQIVATVLLLASPLFMAIVASAQSTPDYGAFEFGRTRTMEGVFYAAPVPSLYLTPQPENHTNGPGYHLLLCSEGKFGIPDTWFQYDGKKVSLEGTLIHRGNVSMLETSGDVLPKVLGDPAPVEQRSDTEVIGEATLVGELVDTKCYLGVMRPATGKVHRACAIRCLSGGVPPGIRLRRNNLETVVLLAGRAGEPLQYDVGWAGLQIEAKGILERQQGFCFIRVHTLSLFEAPGEPEDGETGGT